MSWNLLQLAALVVQSIAAVKSLTCERLDEKIKYLEPIGLMFLVVLFSGFAKSIFTISQ